MIPEQIQIIGTKKNHIKTTEHQISKATKHTAVFVYADVLNLEIF